MERISDFDPLLEMVDPSIPLLLSSASFSVEGIWVVCHYLSLVGTILHFVLCGGCIKTFY